MDLSDHDATFDFEDLEAVAPGLKKITSHPILFGIGVGVANGALAYGRKKTITARGALATAAILALGETILALDETTEERKGRPAAWVGVLSGVGVVAGLALFTDWEQWSGGDRPLLIAQTVPQLTPAEPTTMVA